MPARAPTDFSRPHFKPAATGSPSASAGMAKTRKHTARKDVNVRFLDMSFLLLRRLELSFCGIQLKYRPCLAMTAPRGGGGRTVDDAAREVVSAGGDDDHGAGDLRCVAATW